jgi:hypothetical protein
MIKAILVIALVVAVLVGGLFVLRNSGSAGMPGADVIDRAKQRSEQQAAAEHEEDRH